MLHILDIRCYLLPHYKRRPIPDFLPFLELQDEETGSWYQHRGRDFKVALNDYLQEDGNILGARKGFGMWPGCI